MRVVIDAVPLLIRSAGVKNYLYYWIQHLRRIAGTAVIRTFPSLASFRPLTHESSVAGPWRTWRGLAALALANYSGAPVLDWLTSDADIFHATNLVRQPPTRARLTATVYDLTCWLMPETHSAANIRADRSFASTLKRADRLIAISHNTKNDAVRVLNIPPERISVIYPGVAESFFHVENDSIQTVCARYKLKRPFMLFTGTIEPRKNLDVLLDAFEGLAPSVRQEFDLVIAGPMGWAPASTAVRLRSGASGLHYLGYVPEQDIAPLTAAATVFVYPSLYEGFGFPVAQAMAAGVPAVVSNVSSLPEIAGDAALLVDPRSVSSVREALARLLLSPDLRETLAARGKQRAQEFHWEVCAARSLKFFQEVAGA
jgi:glycosyltransferase involved in cell wall biosynthesis